MVSKKTLTRKRGGSQAVTKIADIGKFLSINDMARYEMATKNSARTGLCRELRKKLTNRFKAILQYNASLHSIISNDLPTTTVSIGPDASPPLPRRMRRHTHTGTTFFFSTPEQAEVFVRFMRHKVHETHYQLERYERLCADVEGMINDGWRAYARRAMERLDMVQRYITNKLMSDEGFKGECLDEVWSSH